MNDKCSLTFMSRIMQIEFCFILLAYIVRWSVNSKTYYTSYRNCAMSDKKRDKRYKILLNSLALSILIFIESTAQENQDFEKKKESHENSWFMYAKFMIGGGKIRNLVQLLILILIKAKQLFLQFNNLQFVIINEQLAIRIIKGQFKMRKINQHIDERTRAVLSILFFMRILDYFTRN